MSIRNIDQLILVRQLFVDALALAARDERLSLTKAVILLDLAVEQSLNSVVLNFDPDFTPDEATGRQDMKWATLWTNATRTLNVAKGKRLAEYRELSRLHELRNLVQHNGTEPTRREVLRYQSAVEKMLNDLFLNAYGLNFQSFRPWDAVANVSLRQLLAECEYFVDNGDARICIAGCVYARRQIVAAVHEYSISSWPFPWREAVSPPYFAYGGLMDQPDPDVRELRRETAEVTKALHEQLRTLESDVLLTGLGVHFVDNRKFSSFGKTVNIGQYADGRFSLSFNGEEKDRSETAAFMLDYLFKLIRRVDETYPEILPDVKFELSLQEQFGGRGKS